jgi:hypothetical protein
LCLIIYTGNGGPSGTGKRPSGETVFPQPVFLQESSTNSNSTSNSDININNNSIYKDDDIDNTISVNIVRMYL